MSPERSKRELDGRTDLFSFSAVLYQMVTGQLPFRGETSGMIFTPFWTARPCRRWINPEVPAKPEEIINKALRRTEILRYQHASEMSTDLKRLSAMAFSRARYEDQGVAEC
jgi:serine/threonine protein kinase